MIHPHTELRFISHEIGFGVVATEDIPQGTIMWVLDPLDHVITPPQAAALPHILCRGMDIYAYLNGDGNRILCWDNARFVNHSCEPTLLAPGYMLEIAVRDIHAGEQITDDYGSLNIEKEFQCACGSVACRGTIRPADFERLADGWDKRVREAFQHFTEVPQPLWELVQEKAAIQAVLEGKAELPSIRVHALGLVTASD